LRAGLLSEEYDPVRRRQVGNLPQALSHLSLVRAADAIAAAEKGHEEELPLVRGESEGDQAASEKRTGNEELSPATGESGTMA
jgi:hypothetical protein